jgi:hypothetical protein
MSHELRQRNTMLMLNYQNNEHRIVTENDVFIKILLYIMT